MIRDDHHACQLCGEPATRTVTDHEDLPDDMFWEVDPLSPPWHLCERHSHSPENCRARLVGMRARVEGALAQLDGLAEDCRNTETITTAGDCRELLLKMQASIEANLARIADA